MAQTSGRGTSWVSVTLGWLAALGAALILKARAVGGPASFSGNDCTGAHRSSGGRKLHRPAWRRHTARSGQ